MNASEHIEWVECRVPEILQWNWCCKGNLIYRYIQVVQVESTVFPLHISNEQTFRDAGWHLEFNLWKLSAHFIYEWRKILLEWRKSFPLRTRGREISSHSQSEGVYEGVVAFILHIDSLETLTKLLPSPTSNFWHSQRRRFSHITRTSPFNFTINQLFKLKATCKLFICVDRDYFWNK